FGFTALSPQDNPGFDRLTGLAPSAPLAGLQFAIAMTVGWAFATSSGKWRPLTWLGVAISLTALLASGGRVGFAGVGLAVVCALLAGWVRIRHAVVGLVGLAGLVWLAPHVGLSLFTLERLLGTAASSLGTDFGSGRFETLPIAARAVLTDPLGHGLDQFVETYRATPHTPILYFGLAGGLAAAAITLWLSVRIAARALRPLRLAQGSLRAAFLVLAVFVAAIMFEPTGPFVGVEMITLLLLCTALVDTATASSRSPARVEGVGIGEPYAQVQQG